jgi:hypothetical protein
MEVDTVIDMSRMSLSHFLDDTVFPYQMLEDFIKDPKPDSGWLGLWLLENLIDDHRYAGASELSSYRNRFRKQMEQQNVRRASDKKENKPVWSEEHVDKMCWSFDIFLMEMASNYIEN